MAELLLASIVIALVTFAGADYDVQRYCQLVTSGTKLPSLDSCQTYYTCMQNMVIKSSCSDNNVFDKDAQGCIPESQSTCSYGLTNPCHNKHEQFTYCSNGCNWYNYCLNGQIAGNGTCFVGQRFNAADGTCIFGDCNSNYQYDICDIMPDGVFFGDTEICRAWHKCVNRHQQSGECGNSLVYDVASGYCLANEGGMCERTSNVVQGQQSGPPEQPCTDTTQVVGDANVCSVYYTCEIATQIPAVTYKWVQKRCETQYFDVISKTCSGTLVARAYPGCDRCELKSGYSRTYWTNANDPNCERYFTCQNGQKVGNLLRSCKEDYFFDEGAQSCVGAEERLPEYIQNNGACQNYTCNEETRVCSLPGTQEGGGDNTQPPIDNGTNENTGSETKKPDNSPETKPENPETKPDSPESKPDSPEAKPGDNAEAKPGDNAEAKPGDNSEDTPADPQATQ